MLSAPAITSNTRLGERPGNVRLRNGAAGLDRPSVVNVAQIATVDRQRLDSRLGVIPRTELARVDDGLRLALHL